MANIRLKAATQGGLAFNVAAPTAGIAYDGGGITLNVEPQDSEIAFSADPIVTDKIYRARAEPQNHEILLRFKAIPFENLPAVSFPVVDGDPIFSIQPLFADTVTATQDIVFSISPVFADTPLITDTPFLSVSRPLADTFSLSDAQVFTVGFNPEETPTVTDDPTFSVSATMAGDTVTMNDVFDFTRVLPTHTPSDSVSVSQNIVLQTTKPVVDSISASDNTYEIGAFFEGDGGLFNSAGLVSETPPFKEEFALQLFST
jgi:hypothetical protein|tara:strand:+ start:1028 stop:1804 length:777 start_codon:yes stop_codon:yes gene_type:complete